MNILVTGATGRVGVNLVKALLEKGHQVRGFIFQTMFPPKQGVWENNTSCFLKGQGIDWRTEGFLMINGGKTDGPLKTSGPRLMES